MNKQDLQIFLGWTITESKMSGPAKLQMLEFIQHEADLHQLMAVAMDGKIVKLDEQAKQIVEDRFKVYHLQEITPKLKTSVAILAKEKQPSK